MSIRRNFFIRTVAGIAGDSAASFALASVCIWVIQSAALGLFLSFLVWLLGLIAWLAVSQYAVHPAVAALLSDRKLDKGLAASLESARAAVAAASSLWGYAQQFAVDFRSMAKSA
ncbi:MAG: hypothetical protein KGO01_05585 [Burkholderiales bacterium]|nr:hypothetical protein [Burkholderiales bacterium]